MEYMQRSEHDVKSPSGGSARKAHSPPYGTNHVFAYEAVNDS
jgi:hypothetical protein